MTVHYNLQLLETETVLKLTYRSGKFRKIEKIKGSISDKQLHYIGMVIPPKESQISAYNERYIETARIEPLESQTKPKSLYSQFSGHWFTFYKEFTGLDYAYSGADGKALKQIISKLAAMCEDEEQTYMLWVFILGSWKNLDKFHHQHTDLKYINSKLNVLLNAIKQQTSNSAEVFTRAMESDQARSFNFK